MSFSEPHHNDLNEITIKLFLTGFCVIPAWNVCNTSWWSKLPPVYRASHTEVWEIFSSWSQLLFLVWTLFTGQLRQM